MVQRAQRYEIGLAWRQLPGGGGSLQADEWTGRQGTVERVDGADALVMLDDGQGLWINVRRLEEV
jgi:hypothetical protein